LFIKGYGIRTEWIGIIDFITFNVDLSIIFDDKNEKALVLLPTSHLELYMERIIVYFYGYFWMIKLLAMKKRRAITILFSMILSVNYLFAQPVDLHGQLWVDGTKLKDKNGNVTELRGMSYGWHNWWPRFYNAGTVKWLHQDWGCSLLRFAIGAEPDSGFIKKPEWTKELLTTVVNAGISEGIYVIIDWHSHNINLKEAKAFFTEMAQLYGKYPNIIYEIFNEPDQESWGEIKAYSIEIITAIREIDPDNIILVGTPRWGQDVDLAAQDPITGFKNIMYTVHFYAATHKQWLRDKADVALKKGLPIFVSECAGMFANGDGEMDYPELETWLEWMKQRQISWAMWSIADKNETCSVLTPKANSEGNWGDGDIKESGKYARSLLRDFAAQGK
jgi:endoglucanase